MNKISIAEHISYIQSVLNWAVTIEFLVGPAYERHVPMPGRETIDSRIKRLENRPEILSVKVIAAREWLDQLNKLIDAMGDYSYCHPEKFVKIYNSEDWDQVRILIEESEKLDFVRRGLVGFIRGGEKLMKSVGWVVKKQEAEEGHRLADSQYMPRTNWFLTPMIEKNI